MTSIALETYYDTHIYTEVELPEGYTPADISVIHIKWGKGQIEFNDGTTMNFEEDGNIIGDIKRPYLTKGFGFDEDGDVDFDEEVYVGEDF